MKKLIALAIVAVAAVSFAADYTPVTKEIGLVAQTSATVTLNPAAYTPVYVGQILIGTVSNEVYVAEAISTNSWIRVN